MPNSSYQREAAHMLVSAHSEWELEAALLKQHSAHATGTGWLTKRTAQTWQQHGDGPGPGCRAHWRNHGPRRGCAPTSGHQLAETARCSASRDALFWKVAEEDKYCKVKTLVGFQNPNSKAYVRATPREACGGQTV
uniref:Uncharacterized protein n=1 Tax=Rangifer tarandus platyrhynchus TaxID=3082113 RepID=A0ACB0E7M8_RANTA|nr:unnamed protein product [Rangifer tarandus platyrhynchus]